MHEGMLFYRGSSVTHWEFGYFRRIGVIGELGQYDLFRLIILQGHTMSLYHLWHQCVEDYISVTFSKADSTLSESR